ncbi:MAG: glycosyltransferase family 4 protein, partial [Nanoarchaeota archaeon]|nr:glycosyltransferase family 4 protein [Nanoarchaeota archaeon]
MKDSIDVVYVVASKLGTIGMGTAAYNAIKQLEHSELSYKIFCRGYNRKLELNNKNIISAGYLEYLSLPLRFMEKKLHFKINPFGYINKKFGNFVLKNLPECKIYHTWPGISPESINKAKKEGAFLILEAANSHPMNSAKIMNDEYEKFGMNEYIVNIDKIKNDSDIYKNFDYIMCPSNFVFDSFLREGFRKEKLVLMPYGTDVKKFHPTSQSHSGIKFIFVGSIQLRKGIQYLFKAWEELNFKNAELIVVGRVWPDAKKIVDKYKNNSTIRFCGVDSNLKKYYSEADVFVFPSLEEGSALVNYEAMASGIPIIATLNAGSVARDKKDGFIIPIRNTEKLKEKMRYFYNNPSEIQRMGKNARKRV